MSHLDDSFCSIFVLWTYYFLLCIILKHYDSSSEDCSESLLPQVDETLFDKELVESGGVGGSDGLGMISSVDEDTSASLQSIASNLCCMHLFSGLFNTEWKKSRVSARRAFTFFWRMLFRRTKAIVRMTISKRPVMYDNIYLI